MQSCSILFPHQLFQDHALHKLGHTIYLVEEYLFFKEFNFHKRKLAYHRATMKSFEQQLLDKGLHVKYIDALQEESDIRKLIPYLKAQGFQKVYFIHPTDNWLEKRLQELISSTQLAYHEYENPLFINTREDLKHFFKPTKKSFFHTTFYKQQRTKHKILLNENGEPEGGKWSFDDENRKKFPKGKTPPNIPFVEGDGFWAEAVQYVEENFGDNLGLLSQAPLYPIDAKRTEKWLNVFLQERFESFGDYEDAIVQEQSYLHHSLLTPMLNIGLISPQQVVNATLIYARKNNIPINSLEGFIRQIIGWREFIRGMYVCKGSFSRTQNFWGFERTIPAAFYKGSTGIPPIDATIKKILKDGYCHHIERLMVLGNFMLLCEFHPDEVYRWFMELFIDAYDWVMVPNVYGMSQFADGGLFATKPYISSSNYILKMSNYKKGSWQKHWDGLFWRFMHVNRDFFEKNPRLGMLLSNWDRMDPDKKSTHIANAESFLESLEA